MALFKGYNPNDPNYKGLYDRAESTRYRSLPNKGGGSQNPSFREPFLTDELPNIYGDRSDGEGLLGGTNFVLRSGTLSRSLDDASRITQLLFNTGRGRLFVAKQNVLSRTGVKTEASGILNEGAYLPTSTIAQVAANGLGAHLNKQGLNPFRGTGADDNNNVFGLEVPNLLGLPSYAQTVKSTQETQDNRLVGFYNNKIITNTSGGSQTSLTGLLGKVASKFAKFDGENILFSYEGGPGSQLGVGRTQIRMFQDQRSGQNNIRLNLSGFFSSANIPSKVDPKVKFKSFNVGSIVDRAKNESSAILGGATSNLNTGDIPFYDYSVFNRAYHNVSDVTLQANQIINPNSSVSLNYFNLTGESALLNISEGGVVDSSQNKLLTKDRSVYKEGLTTDESVTGGTTLTQEQIRLRADESKKSPNKILPDFRSEIKGQPTSLDYSTRNIEQRVGLGDPGKKGDVSNYQTGKILPGDTKSSPVDKINAFPLYKSGTGPTQNPDKNDLVKFRIAAVDSANPSNSVYMHFRAFLGSFSDSYDAEWNAQKYMGRAESFYKYSGFNRTISMDWKVAAQSKNELMIMYQKLNYLASNLTPDYVNNQYMGGPLVRLTVGSYLWEQYGFIENLTFSIPEQSPWEIGIPTGTGETLGSNVVGSGGTQKDDKSVKELPHYIDVSGFTFRPIHKFVPQKQKNSYSGNVGGQANAASTYGLQQYISLANSSAASGYNTALTDPYDIGKQSVTTTENTNAPNKITL